MSKCKNKLKLGDTVFTNIVDTNDIYGNVVGLEYYRPISQNKLTLYTVLLTPSDNIYQSDIRAIRDIIYMRAPAKGFTFDSDYTGKTVSWINHFNVHKIIRNKL